MGLSHRKGNPWRVNPFRATARARTGNRLTSIPVSCVRKQCRSNSCAGYNRGIRTPEACFPIPMAKIARSQDIHSCPGDPGGFKPP